MASSGNVFGIPITDETLRRMPEFDANEVISKRDRAQVAMYFMNSENNDAAARKHAEELKKRRGTVSQCPAWSTTLLETPSS
ncbi:hypothetical protein SLA2020_358600 [Shorea laevis]